MEAHLWVRIGPYATPHLLTCLPSYPAASRQHMHITKAYLPADVAKVLAVNPLLVQKAVETFYTRDALQLRVRPSLHLAPVPL